MPWDCLQPLFSKMGIINNNYLPISWAIWYLFYPTFEDYVKYYITNIIQIRKSKIDMRKFAASNDCVVSQEKNVMEKAIIINSDNNEIDDVNE